MSAIDGVASPDWPFIGLRPFERADSAFFFGREEPIKVVGELVAASGFAAIVGSSGSGKSSLVSAGLLPLLAARADENWRCEAMRPGKAPIEALALSIMRLRGADDLDEAWEERIRFCLRSSQFGVAEAISLFPVERRKDRFLIVVDQFEELFRFAALNGGRNPCSSGVAQNRDDATAFVRLLLAAGAVDSVDIHIVITMRSDFIGDCAQFHGLPEAVTHRQYLTPGLTRDERALSICGPIAKAHAKIDPQLVQRVLNDTTDEVDQLPIIQHVMMCCWQRAASRAAGGAVEIEMHDYLDVGGVAKALSTHADQVLEEFGAGGAVANGGVSRELIAKRVFQALTDVDANGRVTRRPMAFAELAHYVASVDWDEAECEAAVRDFVGRMAAPDCSFLRAPPDGEFSGDSIIDIGHEALIRGWSKLKGDGDEDWIREEKEAGDRYRDLIRRVKQGGTIASSELPIYETWWRNRRPTRTWARRFEDAKDERSFLLDAESVIVRSRQAAQDIEKTAAEAARAKLEAARATAAAEAAKAAAAAADAEAARATAAAANSAAKAAEEARARIAADAEAARAVAAEQKAKRIAAEARIKRQKSTTYWILAVAFIAAVAFAVAIQWRNAEIQTRQRLLTLEVGESILRATALVGAADAVNLLISAPISDWSPDYVSAVREALSSLREVRRIRGFSDPAGKKHAVAGAVANVSFNPKQPILAVASWETSTVHMLRYEDHGRKVSWLDDMPAPVAGTGLTTLRWSPDGNKLYFGIGSHGAIVIPCSIEKLRAYLSLCAGRSGDLKTELSGPAPTGFAAWSPDGKTLVTNGFQGTPQLWDAETGKSEPLPAGADKPDASVTSIAFSGTGAIVAEGQSSGGIALRDAKSGAPIQSLSTNPQASGPAQMIFNPSDDRQLLGLFQGGPAAMWKFSAKDAQANRTPLRTGNYAMVMQAAFDPSGAFAVTAANDGSLRLYRLEGDTISDPTEMRGHSRAVFALDVAPDGTIASGSADGTLRFWRAESALDRPLEKSASESESEWLKRVGRDNLPFVDFGEDRIKLPEKITCAWAGTCPNPSE